MLRLPDRLDEVLIAARNAAATLLIFLAVTHRSSTGLAADLVAFARSNGMPLPMVQARTAFKAVTALSLTPAQEAWIYLFVGMAKFGASCGKWCGIC